MTSKLRRYIDKQQFNPDLLGVFFNPFFLARRRLWQEMAAAGKDMEGPLLDVGCGTKPYRELFDVARYVGLDIDSESARQRGIADAYYGGGRFPFDDASFPSVLCNQVLEHVFNPDVFLKEIHRVLEKGGTLLLTIPFIWDEHEQPYDYARYSTFGLKALLERNGFRVLRQRKLLADASVLFQLTNAYLFKITRSRFGLINKIATVLLMAPISMMGMMAGLMLPKNEDMFLDQLIVAKRL